MKGLRREAQKQEKARKQEEKLKRKSIRKRNASEKLSKKQKSEIATSSLSTPRSVRSYTGGADDIGYRSRNPDNDFLTIRAAEFEHESFSLVTKDGQQHLVCAACPHILQLFRSSDCLQHIAGVKHQQKLKLWKKDKFDSKERIKEIEEYEYKINMQGRKTVAMEAKKFRLEVFS